MTGGYTLSIKDGKAHFDYNYLYGKHYNLTSQVLPQGNTELKYNFIKTDMFAGTGEIYINGTKDDTVEMPAMHKATYSLAETSDVGRDT